MNRFFIACSSLVLIAPFAAAGTLKVPQQLPTIGSAVYAAASGDTIIVAKGVYHENVLIQNKAVRLVAKSGAIIDARHLGVNLGNCIKIVNGAGTVIDGFTLRHAYTGDSNGAGLFAPSDGVRIERVRVFNCAGAGIVVSGADAQVSRSTVKGCNGGIDVTGSNVRIEQCVVENDGERGMRVEGPNAVVRKCRIETVEDGYGLRVGGSIALVEQLIVRGISDDRGIVVDSSNATLRKLTIRGVGNGNAAVSVAGPDCRIEQTSIADCGAQAVDILSSAHGCTMTKCTFGRCGTKQEPTVAVGSDGALLDKCVIRDGDGNGVLVDGDGFDGTDTRIERCRYDGIHVTAATQSYALKGLKVLGCHGEGFDIRAFSANIEGNIAKGNRTDYASTVVIIGVLEQNAFATTGAPQID